MMKLAHVIGNGPSKKDFKNEPFGDLFGCNLSSFQLPLKATVIMDKVVIDHIHNMELTLPWPVIIPSCFKRICEQCPHPPKIEHLLPDGLYNGESTGHYAVLYCIERYEEVHMWGFDSLKKDSVESDTKDSIPNAPVCEKNFVHWRKNWDKLFAMPAAKACRIVIH